jgi:hypothetical protein
MSRARRRVASARREVAIDATRRRVRTRARDGAGDDARAVDDARVAARAIDARPRATAAGAGARAGDEG